MQPSKKATFKFIQYGGLRGGMLMVSVADNMMTELFFKQKQKKP